MISKPKLWKYKTGSKAGKLRPNAKEYLSQQMKLYYSTGLTAYERKEREEIKEEQRGEMERIIEKLKVIKRERKQLVYNCKYAISIRALIINGKNIIQQDLENAIDEFLQSNPNFLRIFFTTEGMERKFISQDEDKGLIPNTIYIETNIRGQINLIQW